MSSFTGPITPPPIQQAPPGVLSQDPAAQTELRRRQLADRLHAWSAHHHRRTPDRVPTGLDHLWHGVASALRARVPRQRRMLLAARRIDQHRANLESLPSSALRRKLERTRQRGARGRLRGALEDQALALIAEQARRELGLTPYVVQLAGAYAMTRGCLAEMATGEGKTLTAVLAATRLAWAGGGVHVVTVNDYLAQRDAEFAEPLLRACGLRVACVTGEDEPDARRAAYAADVTYTTNKELAADFLRDAVAGARGETLTAEMLQQILAGQSGVGQNPPVMRGLRCAIVDEADSVLIDEAATPLILSSEGDADDAARRCHAANQIAIRLKPGTHYAVNDLHREVRFTPRGKTEAAAMAKRFRGTFLTDRLALEHVDTALTARHFFLRGEQYVLQDDEVVIVDPSTGRRMPDRSWRNGLHEAVQAKEGVPVTAPKQTLARVSFQRFFRMYPKLAGMTGTARETRAELMRVYRLPVVPIPRHRPLQREVRRETVFANQDDKWQAIAQQITELQRAQRPVLVGTASVEDSEILSAKLNDAAVPHVVLNAILHEQEAEIVAQAGLPGAVTVATNMAGRGTDIRLANGVADQGGLVVLMPQRNLSRRVDRQLMGRCARQGEPGLALRFAAMDDRLVTQYAPAWMGRLRRTGSSWLARRVIDFAQRRAEGHGRRNRAAVMRQDDQMDDQLGFARDTV